jgi:serine/threonine protein kinase
MISTKQNNESFSSKGFNNITLSNAGLGIVDSKIAIDTYVYEKVIGQGSYAVVRQAYDRNTGQKVAIKTYEKFKLYDAQRRKNVRREMTLLQELDHPNIIKLYRTIDTVTQVRKIVNN